MGMSPKGEPIAKIRVILPESAGYAVAVAEEGDDYRLTLTK